MASASYGPSSDLSKLKSDIQEIKELQAILSDSLQFPSYDEITKEVIIRLQ